MNQDLIRMATPVLGDSELQYVVDAVKTGWISGQGPYVSHLEEEFSRYCGVRYGIATTSGTTALHLALTVLRVQAGDEVIIPTLTMIATVNTVTYTSAKPVLVDSEACTWNMNPARIEEKITSRTKAIMVVHTYGHPVDMDPVLEIARRHGLYVVEDAAEAHGAEYKGKRAGSLGDLGCFSFYANKIITTGEGGMIVTDNKELAKKACKLKDQAYEKNKRFWHRELGFNYRMTNVQAAIGMGQLGKIDNFIETRRRNARLYNSLLAGCGGITLPPEAPWAKNVYWMYSLLVEDSFGLSRNELMTYLREQGVDSRTFFYPVHMQPFYRAAYAGQSYPQAEKLSRKGLNLPSGNDLTQVQVKRIAEVILAAKETKK